MNDYKAVKRLEIRVFYEESEMHDDFNKFINENAISVNEFETSAKTSTGWEVRWYVCNDDKPIRQRIAGLQINRIRCDVRVPVAEKMYMMTRIRNPNPPVFPITLFYKEVWL